MANSALLLIGFQNDYFSKQGILNPLINESSHITGVLDNTFKLIESHGDKFKAIISTPICFTNDYSELINPVGILSAIKEAGAFKEGTFGAQEIDQIKALSHIITTIPGKRGLNAFSNTKLENFLRKLNIDHIVLSGTVTSICIDSTGRSAHEKGFNVTVLTDCTSSRTPFEQQFYCENVFPLYANVIDSHDVIIKL
ncbi:cysteine hydrolase [Pseudoalteromonas sp.]|uniref:cysteine hydrolase n=1 Tax=Pseudoalteromonas sp. TaxID=53249 RepID=UPI001BD18D92|nr:cysteine hydrolase [Pseudoalteromonas sp.]